MQFSLFQSQSNSSYSTEHDDSFGVLLLTHHFFRLKVGPFEFLEVINFEHPSWIQRFVLNAKKLSMMPRDFQLVSFIKGSLILESFSFWLPSPKKIAKFTPLSTFQLKGQWSDLTPFFEKPTEVRLPLEFTYIKKLFLWSAIFFVADYWLALIWKILTIEMYKYELWNTNYHLPSISYLFVFSNFADENGFFKISIQKLPPKFRREK